MWSRIARGCLAACASAIAACGGERSERPSVLLITLDTTRADALGCYGNPAQITPHIDALAREGVLYESARTVAPLTLPAHASMLTGLYPPRHGIADNGYRALPRSAQTVAELARDAGCDTAAFVAAIVLDPSFGLAQGFDTYEAPSRADARAAHRVTEAPAGEVVDRALAWFEARDRSRPYFVWVHLFEPHAPYAPRAELRERARGSAYLGEVAAADEAVGRLLGRLRETGELERAAVVLTADHGESLGQHGEDTHGAFVYDSTLRVPLIVRFSDGSRAGERSSELASAADVAPTVLAALGIPAPVGIDGLDLAHGVPAQRGVYFESYEGFLAFGASPLAGWLDARGKYIHSSAPEFFDVANDARERKSGALDDSTLAAYRAAIGAVWSNRTLEPDGDTPLDRGLGDELRRLGYAGLERQGGDLPSPLEVSTAPSPRELLPAMRQFWAAADLAYAGDYDAAIAALSPLAAQHPESALIVTSLSDYLVQRGRTREAEPLLRGLVAQGSARAGALNNLGWCREQAGDADEAAQWYERALALDPAHPLAAANLERVQRAAQR